MCNEHDIAIEISQLLRECFIATSQTQTVLYVENDAVVSKAPNEEPVIIKYLTGRNPDLDKKFSQKRTFKIKKRQVKNLTK